MRMDNYGQQGDFRPLSHLELMFEVVKVLSNKLFDHVARFVSCGFSRINNIIQT